MHTICRGLRHLLLTPKNEGKWGYHWTMKNCDPNKTDAKGKREIASHYYPMTGPYASGDEAVLDYQCLLMKYAGLDGVMVAGMV